MTLAEWETAVARFVNGNPENLFPEKEKAGRYTRQKTNLYADSIRKTNPVKS